MSKGQPSRLGRGLEKSRVFGLVMGRGLSFFGLLRERA